MPGHYLGTEIEGKWWKRYRKGPFFARGNGTFWYNNTAFYFLKYLTRRPLIIPLRTITSFHVGRWHAGRWCAGMPIFKITRVRNGQHLISGFLVTRNREEIQAIISDLKKVQADYLNPPISED